LALGFLFALGSCSKSEAPKGEGPADPPFIVGADLSFSPQMEASAYSFKDSTGAAFSSVDLFKSHGWNAVRLRLWVNPSGGYSGFQEVLEASKRYREAGYLIWLDIHYSDVWADPAHQTKPESWKDLDYGLLLDSVRAYTERVVGAIQPDMVQPGNEINGGLLWPTGHLSSVNGFLELMRTAVQACRKAAPEAEIWIHYAGYEGAVDFYSLLEYHRIDYDGVAISYYPWWHGDNLQWLGSALDGLNALTDKPTLIAETAYPHTLQWGDWTQNVFGNASDLHPDFPASPQGQQAFLNALDSVCRSAPECRGWCYWAPDWVPWRGVQATDGSAWENLALFDFNGQALRALDRSSTD
jgi:arabinogalactan endo-1,4-beta-galactosidase